MEFTEVIKRRRMVHAFTDEPLEPGTTERLLRAAGFRTQYGVPAQWTPIGAIAIGHPDPDSDPVPAARASDRKTLDELVHRGRW